MIGPRCQRTIREGAALSDELDPERPGLLGCLRGETGDGFVGNQCAVSATVSVTPTRCPRV